MDAERTGKYHQKKRKLKDYDELLEGIDEVEKYENTHEHLNYDIELVDVKSGVYGVVLREEKEDLLNQIYVEPFK